MKRKVASRKIKRKCVHCNDSFVKGEVYYTKRVVFTEHGEVFADEYITCPKCKYKYERQAERYAVFIESGACKHPVTDMVWRTMVGEDYAMEPSHMECFVCRGVV